MLQYYLSGNLERTGCIIDHANNDADVCFVQTTVPSARYKDSVLFGDVTDVLVIQLPAEMDAHNVFLKPEPKESLPQNKIWDITQS